MWSSTQAMMLCLKVSKIHVSCYLAFLPLELSSISEEHIWCKCQVRLFCIHDLKLKLNIIWSGNLTGQRITQTLRRNVYSAIIKQDIAFFDRSKTGELINRLSADTLLVSQCITNNIGDGIRNIAFCTGSLGMMVNSQPFYFISTFVICFHSFTCHQN